MLVQSINCHGPLVLSMVKELNWAWVAIVIDEPPSSLNCFHSLEDLPIEIYLIRGNNKVRPSKPRFRLRSHH